MNLHLSYEEFKYFYGDLGITYWTKYNYLDLNYVGKYNVWDEDWEAGRIDITTGQNAPGYGIRSKKYINIFANKEYLVEFGNYPGASVIVYFYDENKSFISYVGVPSSEKFTTISNCAFIRFAVFTSSAVTYNNDIRIYQPMMNLGRYVFTGEETWSPNGQCYQWGTINDIKPCSNFQKAKIFSSVLEVQTVISLYNNGNTLSGIGINDQGKVSIGAIDYNNLSSLNGSVLVYEKS